VNFCNKFIYLLFAPFLQDVPRDIQKSSMVGRGEGNKVENRGIF
jgi:hypothetical protein